MQRMKHIYAAAITVKQHDANYIKFVAAACAVIARDDAEAEGIALRFARERWLQADGYFSYQASVYQIPSDWIRWALQETARETPETTQAE